MKLTEISVFFWILIARTIGVSVFLGVWFWLSSRESKEGTAHCIMVNGMFTGRYNMSFRGYTIDPEDDGKVIKTSESKSISGIQNNGFKLLGHYWSFQKTSSKFIGFPFFGKRYYLQRVNAPRSKHSSAVSSLRFPRGFQILGRYFLYPWPFGDYKSIPFGIMKWELQPDGRNVLVMAGDQNDPDRKTIKKKPLCNA